MKRGVPGTAGGEVSGQKGLQRQSEVEAEVDLTV